MYIPNIPHSSVPVGKSAEQNVEVRQWMPDNFSFENKEKKNDHVAAKHVKLEGKGSQHSIYFRQVAAILAKDFISEFHSRDIFNSMAFFGILAVLIFGFAFGLQGNVSKAAVPGILWSAIGFAGILGLSKSLINEHKSSGVEGLMLSPMEGSAIFLGKALGNFGFITIVEAVLLLLIALLFNLPVIRLDILITLLAGTVGYAAMGTLLAMIAVNTRTREIMLPILFLPLAAPVLLAGIQITGGFLQGLTVADLAGWIQLLGIYDLAVLVVAMLTFELTLGD